MLCYQRTRYHDIRFLKTQHMKYRCFSQYKIDINDADFKEIFF